MDTNFEQIVPWNGAQDTGKDVRLKWQRNFDRIKANFEELTDLFEKVNLGTDEAPAWAIRAKYGLYTDEWISAKGKNPAAGSTPVAVATELSKLTDVLLTSPDDGQVLTYDATLGKWVNREPVAGGLDVEELAEYLTTNRYATQDWITQQGYATQSWASSQFALRTVAINAGTGLTGGGNLTASRTLSLATTGTAGTYTKVTTDAYGRVTKGATLQAGDIPTLSISKISGLQSALNDKLDADDFTELFEKVYVSGYGYAIRAKLALYTEGWLSAKGMNGDAGGTVVAGASSWDEIEGRPTTFPPSAHTHAWGDITGKPTTLAGYGITDAFCERGQIIGASIDDMTSQGAYIVNENQDLPSGAYEWGTLLNFNSFNETYGMQLYVEDGPSGKSYLRTRYGYNWREWRTLLESHNLGNYNAGSATRLQTARTLWGQSFDGTGNVSGSLTGVTDISMTGYITASAYYLRDNLGRYFYDDTTGKTWLQAGQSGHMALSGMNDTELKSLYLHAAEVSATGSLSVGTYLQVGSARLKWDSTTGALYVEKSDGTACGFYATGFLSAKGANSDAGGAVAGGGSGEVHLMDIVDMVDAWKLIVANYPVDYVLRWPS